jgi:outer membrane lipoprotein-sorting protein
MRFSVVFAISLAVASLSVAAPVAVADEGSSTSTELTLDVLMAQMSAARGVVAQFHERKQIALLAGLLESRGVLYFAPPGRLARFTTEPGYSSLVIDGDTVRFRDGERGEEFDLLGNPMARVFVDNFIVLFNGDIERLRELYEAEFSTEDRTWSLRLTPRSQRLRLAIESIVLTGGSGSGGGGGIRRMELRSSDGDLTTTDLETLEADRRFTDVELETLFSQRIPLRDTPATQ